MELAVGLAVGLAVWNCSGIAVDIQLDLLLKKSQKGKKPLLWNPNGAPNETLAPQWKDFNGGIVKEEEEEKNGRKVI